MFLIPPVSWIQSIGQNTFGWNLGETEDVVGRTPFVVTLDGLFLHPFGHGLGVRIVEEDANESSRRRRRNVGSQLFNFQTEDSIITTSERSIILHVTKDCSGDTTGKDAASLLSTHDRVVRRHAAVDMVVRQTPPCLSESPHLGDPTQVDGNLLGG